MVYWYQRIPDPDAVTERAKAPVSNARLRFATAANYHGMFRDEPEILQAFVNADVPFAVANRTMAEIGKRKSLLQRELMQQAGYTDTSATPQQIAAAQDASTTNRKPNPLIQPGSQLEAMEAVRQGMTGGGDPIAAKKDQGFFGNIVDAGKGIIGGIGEGLTAAFSPISAPLAAGSAQANSEFENMLDAPVPGRDGLSSASLSALSTIIDFGKGIGSLTGLSGTDPNQTRDMQRAGYDPKSGASRYAYYYQSFNAKRNPVSEDDVAKLKNKYDPTKVELAREMVVSGYFEDPVRNFSGLSQEAQQFAQQLTQAGADSEDGKLIRAIQDTSSLSYGGHLANLHPATAELGGTTRQVAAAAGDLIAFWYVDPLVGVSKGIQAAKYGLRGVDASNIEKVTSMLAASADDFTPKGFNAKRFDDTLRTIDKTYNLAKGGDQVAAAKELQKFRLLHPDMMGIFDTLMAMRSGAITRVRPREGIEQLREATMASKGNRVQQPFIFDSAPIGKEKPVWKLSDSADETVDAATSAKARAQLANDLTDYIWYEAITSGRPLYKGKMLLPGQVAVNRRVRQGIAVVRDAIGRQDSKFAKFLTSSEARRAKVDLNGDVVADEMGNAEILTDQFAQQWVKDHYTGSIKSPTLGIGKSFGKAWRYFEQSFSNKTINFDSPESTELFRRWVVQFLPKRHAYALVNEFASSNPAGRYGLFQQTVVASLNAAGMRSTPAARRTIDRMLKGIAPSDEVFGRMGSPLEVYTDPINNTIKIGDADVAAAVHPYQLSTGVQLPSLRELKRVINRSSILGYAAGAMNTVTFDMVTRAWKIMKVANPANMVRQALELYTFTVAGAPSALGGAAQARYLLKAVKGQQKADMNDLKRVAANLEDAVDDQTLSRLDEAIRTGDTATYHGILRDAIKSKGLGDRASEILARMGEDVDVRGLVPGGLTKTALAMAAPLDWLRRTRAATAEKHGLKEKFESPWAQYLDEQALNQYLMASLDNLGAAADNYVLFGENMGRSIQDQVAEGVAKGFGFKVPRVPNSFQWTDSPSIQQWTESIQRVQADELSALVLRRIALEYVGRNAAAKRLKDAVDAANARKTVVEQSDVTKNNKNKTTVKIVNPSTFPKVEIPATAGKAHARKTLINEEINKRAASEIDEAGLKRVQDEVMADPRWSEEALDTPMGFAAYMIGKDPLGQVVRDNAKRSNYTTSGRFAETADDRFEAINEHAKVMVEDLTRRLGGRVTASGDVVFPEELDGVIRKLADGHRITAADLKDISRDSMPEGVIAELFVPDLGNSKPKIRERAVQMMSKAYQFTVSGPLAALASHPVFLSHRRIAYATMDPVFEALTAKGMSPNQAAYLLESAANRRALNMTFTGTDNPGELSVFSELTDNFLMFQRAQEDFLKRFVKATTANPALLARASTLVNAAHHSGVVSVQRIQNDDGFEENQLVFTYPGTAAAVRMIDDAWRSIGGQPDELSMLPQFKGFSSQVRFINPSITNPLQFSANPIIGMPLRGVRTMFPESSQTVTEWLTFMEGGERYFAEQTLTDQFLPSAISRIIPVMSSDEKDGQYASALRSALQYAEAAGVLPEPGVASPDEIQEAQDTIRSMVSNIMIQRAIFGVFAPASPQLADPQEYENNAHAMAEGVNTIREEWFKILEDNNRLFPDDGARALSEAHVEWAKRYPKGKLIVNPNAFTTGSTKMSGSHETAPSTTEATQWMMDNLDWVKENQAIAFHLLPTAEGKWFEAAPYRLQLRQELREHKSLEEFYRDAAHADELSEFYNMAKEVKQAGFANPQHKKELDARFQTWIKQWEKYHPGAAAELDRRNDPNRVHAELAPAVGRAAKGENLPEELKYLQPALQEMYADYQMYREAYASVGRNQRSGVNARYRDYGDKRWTGTPLERLWNDMAKYEDD